MNSPQIPPLQPGWEDRLRGVPSHHFEPVFAQRVQRALLEFAPNCVALETPKGTLLELLWAIEQWPMPCASISEYAVFPFVPGDSIFEAARLAVTQGVSLVAVDLEVEESDEERQNIQLLDPQWAGQLGESWDEALESLIPPPTRSDAAREAHMAARLAHLLASGQRVLWVGGAAHWARILSRLRGGDFQSPAVKTVSSQKFERARLDAAALFFVSGKLPLQTAVYTNDPQNYSEAEILREIVVEALAGGNDVSDTPLLVLGPEDVLDPDPIYEFLQQESCTVTNAASVLTYARNLAATTGLRSTPFVAELLRSAVMVIGPRYAGRLYDLLSRDFAQPSNEFPTLSYEVRGKQHGLWLGERAVLVRPYWPSPSAGLEIQRLMPKKPDPPAYRELNGSGEKNTWICHPDDRKTYREFVQSLFRIVSQLAAPEEKALPFTSGLAEGIDVRATLRGAYNDEIWVRETVVNPLRITNAVIDWSNSSELSPLLQGTQTEHSGWIDPSELFSFGSCSRAGQTKTLSHEPHVQLDHRLWTLLTLDLGNTVNSKGDPSFYDKVIYPLVNLQGDRPYADDVYHWLDIMFQFCAGKPFAYISQYKPSSKIYRVAARHRVKVIYIPLSKIPATMRARNQYFRFMTIPVSLWREVMEHNYQNRL